MTEHARVDPQTGNLLVSLEAWQEMLSCTGAAGSDARVPHGEAREALTEVGAAEGGRMHPTLARPLEAVGSPLAELRIERRATRVSGWMDAHAAILLVPRGEDLFEVAPTAVRFLPDLVARLVELVPRPEGKRLALTMAPGALAEAIAAPGPSATGTGTDTGLPTVRDFWLLETIEPDGGPRIHRLEVLDTDDGLWQLEREQGSVRLQPTTSAGVRRRLTATVAAEVR